MPPAKHLAREGARSSSAASRRALRVLQILLLGSYLGLAALSCSPPRPSESEQERNRVLAAILGYEDRRALGRDELFWRRLLAADPELADRAALALGRIGNPRALPWLYAAMSSPRARVRAAAAFAMGEIEDREMAESDDRQPDPRASAELLRRLEDSSAQVRMRAIEALGKVGRAENVPQVLRDLERWKDDGSPQGLAYADLAIAALMRLGDPAAVPALKRFTRSRNLEIRWRAANALYRLRASEGCDDLNRLLDDADADVRAVAARGVGICTDPRLAEKLHPFLERSRTLFERVAALQALGNLKNPTSTGPVEAALRSAPIEEANPDQIHFALQAAPALGSLGGEEAERVLQWLAQHEGAVAHQAWLALARAARSEESRAALHAAMAPGAFESPESARAAAAALGELGDAEAVRRLEEALGRFAGSTDTRGWLVLPSILTALARTKAAGVDRLVLPFLAANDPVVAQAALKAYRPMAVSQQSWWPIIHSYLSLAETSEAEAKAEALNALEAGVSDPEVQAVLRRALHDRNIHVRRTAARLLRRSGATDLPSDLGPSETRFTETTYELVVAGRKNRIYARLETSRGEIHLRLFPDEAPLTVSNFVTLARQGFYDGLSFMRVVPFFVIQGGDPRNDMEGGPGYTIRCEINRRPFLRGSVGMALSGKDTGGSQFFITHFPQPHLDGRYTCFGRVVAGMSVVERILPGDRIHRVTILERIRASGSAIP